MMKTRTVPSALPIYCAAALWILYSLIFPMYRLIHLILCALLSVGAFFLGKKLFPARVVEYETKPDSGDAEVNRQIDQGLKAIAELHQANADIPSPVITEQLNRMELAARKIYDCIEKQPREAMRVRKFMNYYLPTSIKLLNHYRTLTATGSTGENVTKAIRSIEDSLGMIATAFEKQLDAMFDDEALDITTDIQTLETLMIGDGLADDLPIRNERQQGQTLTL